MLSDYMYVIIILNFKEKNYVNKCNFRVVHMTVTDLKLICSVG